MKNREKEYHRTITMFFWQFAGFGLELPALGTIRGAFGKETVALKSIQVGLFSRHGEVRMTVKWTSGCITDILKAKSAVLDRIIEMRGFSGNMGNSDDTLVPMLDFESGIHKTEAAMDFCLDILEVLGVDVKNIPAPLVGRFTQMSNDKVNWADYGTSLFKARLSYTGRIPIGR